jgi:hypothetical protein
MTTLEDAWAWYLAAREGAKRLAHLAKYWDLLPWGEAEDWMKQLQGDNVFRTLDSGRLAKDAETVQKELDDLAVLVLFSVFEAIVRDLVVGQIRPEVEGLQHAFLKGTSEEILQRVTEGSFFNVLEPFKSLATNDLIEQVNQVRRFRNWVAHGRRPLSPGEQLTLVQPREAYERLKQFLGHIQSPATRLA